MRGCCCVGSFRPSSLPSFRLPLSSRRVLASENPTTFLAVCFSPFLFLLLSLSLSLSLFLPLFHFRVDDVNAATLARFMMSFLPSHGRSRSVNRPKLLTALHCRVGGLEKEGYGGGCGGLHPVSHPIAPRYFFFRCCWHFPDRVAVRLRSYLLFGGLAACNSKIFCRKISRHDRKGNGVKRKAKSLY